MFTRSKASKHSKGSGQRKPARETPRDELYSLMYNSSVKKVNLEFLEGDPAANPSRRRRGKRKNHVALRFELYTPFLYWKEGEEASCASIRASIEPDDDDTWFCSGITLKPMSFAAGASRSASASFIFDCPGGQTVAEFVRIASPLVSFSYKVVATTTEKVQTKRKSRKPQEKIFEHANGCRDFTIQWWILLYKAEVVQWRTMGSNISIPGFETGTTFDTIIGFRYSRGGSGVRAHQSRVSKATFHSGHTRLESTIVGTDLVELPYTNQAEVEEYSRNDSNDGNDSKDDDFEEYEDKPDSNWYWGDPKQPPSSGGEGSYGGGGSYGEAGSSTQSAGGYNVSISRY